MPNNVTHALPQIVADHIAAYNSHDPDALMTTSARDDVVNDIQREFLGHGAISAWAGKEIFAAIVTMALSQTFERHRDIVLHAAMDGDVARINLPDPLILTIVTSASGTARSLN
ncbi:MAG: hypothetical protein JWM91_5433 [Rhodospirillales bacterium]|nr:hypothetical protein [Rhodospirillales bacterium]